ncbi:MAG TPA: hypothetical protein VMX18_04745 [Candidatus Bipolaricaulota bacterium]|nr:hypothetical protein [Candidatus Bipolaricaulota bacterium]
MKTASKIFLAAFIIPLVISGCSCSKNNTSNIADFQIKEREDVKDAVRDWVVFTNPAYRYELRSPKDWTISDVNKDGEDVRFYPEKNAITEDYLGDLRILGYTNWQEHLPLDEFIKTKAVNNYYQMSNAADREELEFRGYYAMRFKNVELKKDQFIDVIVVDTKDSIVAIELHGSYDVLTNIISSMYFY